MRVVNEKKAARPQELLSARLELICPRAAQGHLAHNQGAIEAALATVPDDYLRTSDELLVIPDFRAQWPLRSPAWITDFFDVGPTDDPVCLDPIQYRDTRGQGKIFSKCIRLRSAKYNIPLHGIVAEKYAPAMLKLRRGGCVVCAREFGRFECRGRNERFCPITPASIDNDSITPERPEHDDMWQDICDSPEENQNLCARQHPGQKKRAKFPTSKAPISAVFHSFRLIFGRAIISRNGLEAWMLFPERARAEHSR